MQVNQELSTVPAEGRDDLAFVVRVEGRRGLVQQQAGRVLHQSAGQGDARALATRQQRSAYSHLQSMVESK